MSKVTDYQTIQVPIVGGANPSRSQQLSSAELINLYPDPSPGAAYDVALMSWPGGVGFAYDNVGITVRAYYSSTGELYHATTGANTPFVTELFKTDSSGNDTNLGTISINVSAVMADDGTNLVIASETGIHIYDGTILSGLNTAYDGGSVAFLNNQAIYHEADNNKFWVADPGDPTTVNSLNFAFAESAGDKIKRVFVFKETLYLFGERTTEAWWNSGEGNPPFDRIQNGKMDVGVKTIVSIDSNDNYIYWLGQDQTLYRTSSYTPESVMPASIANEFQSMDFLGEDDGIISCIRLGGQNFVVISVLPSGSLDSTTGSTWVYSEDTGAFFRLQAGSSVNLGGPAHQYLSAFGKVYFTAGIRWGYSMFEADFSTSALAVKQSVGSHPAVTNSTMYKVRATEPINGAKLGLEGGRFMMRRAELICEKDPDYSYGNDTGFTVDISVSLDGGKTYETAQTISMGDDDEDRIRVEYWGMHTFESIQFKIETTSARVLSFHSLALDVKPLGGY